MSNVAGWYSHSGDQQRYWSGRTRSGAQTRPTPRTTYWPRTSPARLWDEPVVAASVLGLDEAAGTRATELGDRHEADALI
jgi:hypothetical protein